jgi:predicted amidophosphoribosyltransferase
MSQRKVVFSFKGEVAAQKARIFLGMRPIRQGHKACLKCDRKFFSLDTANNKLCVDCGEKNSRSGLF